MCSCDGVLNERGVRDDDVLLVARARDGRAHAEPGDAHDPSIHLEHVAELDGALGEQDDARDEVLPHVLHGEADGHREDGPGSEQRAEVDAHRLHHDAQPDQGDGIAGHARDHVRDAAVGRAPQAEGARRATLRHPREQLRADRDADRGRQRGQRDRRGPDGEQRHVGQPADGPVGHRGGGGGGLAGPRAQGFGLHAFRS